MIDCVTNFYNRQQIYDWEKRTWGICKNMQFCTLFPIGVGGWGCSRVVSKAKRLCKPKQGVTQIARAQQIYWLKGVSTCSEASLSLVFCLPSIWYIIDMLPTKYMIYHKCCPQSIWYIIYMLPAKYIIYHIYCLPSIWLICCALVCHAKYHMWSPCSATHITWQNACNISTIEMILIHICSWAVSAPTQNAT